MFIGLQVGGHCENKSHTMGADRRDYVEFGSLELQERRDDAEYLRLENDDDLELGEFELLHQLEKKRHRRAWYWTKILFLVLVVLGATGVVLVFVGPLLLEKVVIVLEWEAETFSRPVLAFVLMASLALFPVFLIPSGPSMWLAGIEFGYGLGFLIIMVGTSFGQAIPYFIGHQLLHNRIRNWLKRWPKQAAVLRVAEQGSWSQQFRAIALLRVSPFPYPFFNYAITVTDIGFGPYIMGSLAGMVPEAFITIYSGKLLRTLADVNHQKRSLTPIEIAYNVFGFCIATVIGVTVTIYGRRAVEEFELREAAEKLDSENQVGQMNGTILEHSEIRQDLKITGERLTTSSNTPRLERSNSLKETAKLKPQVDTIALHRKVAAEIEDGTGPAGV